jgi:hypothetical protein
MNKLAKIAIQSAYAAVILLILGAFALSPTGSTGTISTGILCVETTQDEPQLRGYCHSAAPADENMAPSRKSASRQMAYTIPILSLKTDNSFSKYWYLGDQRRNAGDESLRLCDTSPILASAFLVSSELGRRLTLVGSRPSGTS